MSDKKPRKAKKPKPPRAIQLTLDLFGTFPVAEEEAKLPRRVRPRWASLAPMTARQRSVATVAAIEEASAALAVNAVRDQMLAFDRMRPYVSRQIELSWRLPSGQTCWIVEGTLTNVSQRAAILDDVRQIAPCRLDPVAQLTIPLRFVVRFEEVWKEVWPA